MNAGWFCPDTAALLEERMDLLKKMTTLSLRKVVLAWTVLTTKAHPFHVQLGLAPPSMGSGHPTLLPGRPTCTENNITLLSRY